MPSSDGTGLLEARGLWRAYGRRQVLRDLDLAVAAGEAVAVAGPNGAGKTTLLRVLAGLARPDRGEVKLEGRPLRRDAPEVRRAVGLVSHQTLLYDDLTLHENLAFAARLYGLPTPAAAAAGRARRGRAWPASRRVAPAAQPRAAPARRDRAGAPAPSPAPAPRRAVHRAGRGGQRAAPRRARGPAPAGLGIVLVTHQLGRHGAGDPDRGAGGGPLGAATKRWRARWRASSRATRS